MTGKSIQTVLSDIGYRLTELRKQKGYTNHENFALDHDLPRVQYWRLEKGKANFTIKTLTKVLSIHNVSLEDFFGIRKHVQNTPD
jgi:transcriptional regulator with XRE-family HTH domain